MSLTAIIPDTLLVSGPNGGGVALVRNDRTFAVSTDEATGLAVDDARVAWCVQANGAGSSFACLAEGKLTTHTISSDDLDLHDLAPADDGWYVVATMSNEVLRLDASGGIAQRWAFGGEPDSMHLNSLCVHDGRLLASAFGRFAEHRGYKGKTRGAGLVLDVETGDTVLDGLSQPHSLVSHEGRLFFCDSELGQVVIRERDGSERRATLPGYTRGLSVAGSSIYVGVSRSRNQTDRAVERFASSVVAVLDANDLSVSGYVPVPWDEIYDIRRVEQASQVQALLLLALDAKEEPAAAPVVAQPLPEIAELAQQLAAVESKLVAAISSDIRQMQTQHGEMFRAAEQAQAALSLHQARVEREQARADLEQARAERAERFGRWAAQAWGDASEQRQALEALTEAVIGMETRLATAIGTDIRRMQEAHSAVLEKAGRLDGELAATRSHLATEQAERRQAQERVAEELAHRESVAKELAEHRAQSEARDLIARERLAYLEQALSQTVAAHASERASIEEDRGRLEGQLAAVYDSTSWRITRPFRFASRLARNGFGIEERNLLADWLTRSRWAPLPSASRAALARRVRPAGSARLQLLPASSPGSEALPELAPLHDMPDVFVWAVIDWHFRTQRPQHLARALAEKGHRVFYISNVFVDSDSPGFAVDALDVGGRLFQVHLNVAGAPSIYAAHPTAKVLDRIAESMARLLGWTGTRRSVSIVHHPYWTNPSQFVPNARLVYDCMDHHAGFDGNSEDALTHENALARRADLVVTTSAWLQAEMEAHCSRVALVRNATDFDHFRDAPAEVYRDPDGRRVIGYIGAIAEWFDVDVVRRIAEDHPDCAVVLVGADTAGASQRLAGVDNVRFIGEVPYASLPYWLHGFDVCLLPFRVIPLTLATNPVKIYEYLSAAKPVVATDLPEMSQFGDLVEVASTSEEFALAVGRALRPVDATSADARRAFASSQTWAHRAAEFDAAIAAIDEPKVSVVVLAYNNLDYTDACLFSLESYSDYSNLEIIVVDNASSDGTPDYLREWVTKGENRRIILNDENRGFAAGNNQGLAAATGDYLVMLNNDTYVTPGWVRTLVGHLRRDEQLGIIGPVTNNIGNEARIDIGYGDMAEMIERAGRYTRAHAGRLVRIPVVAFFCAMMPRVVYERVGGLDEAFGRGFFEDDDYCRRVMEAGWHVGCADDVFVHHHLSASFDKLKVEQRQELFERNRAIFESKWGPWRPHSYRT